MRASGTRITRTYCKCHSSCMPSIAFQLVQPAPRRLNKLYGVVMCTCLLTPPSATASISPTCARASERAHTETRARNHPRTTQPFTRTFTLFHIATGTPLLWCASRLPLVSRTRSTFAFRWESYRPSASSFRPASARSLTSERTLSTGSRCADTHATSLASAALWFQYCILRCASLTRSRASLCTRCAGGRKGDTGAR